MSDRRWRAACGLLLLVTPFLLFPSLSLAGTLFAFAAIVFLWLWTGLATRPRNDRGSPKWSLWRIHWRRAHSPHRCGILPYLNAPGPFNLIALPFMLALGASILATTDSDLALPKFAGLLLGLTLWRLLATPGDGSGQPEAAGRGKVAVNGYLLTSVAVLVAGAASTNWIHPWMPHGWLQLPGTETGTHPNQLAGTVLLCWPFSLAILAGAKGRGTGSATENANKLVATDLSLQKSFPGHEKVQLILAGLIAFFGGLMLLLSGSRLGWLGGLAGVGSLAWLWWARRIEWTPRRKWSWAVAAVVIFVAGLAATPLGLRGLAARTEPGLAGPLETVGFRLEVWRYGLEAAADFPVTGVGLGSFRRVVLRLYPITVFPNEDVAHAHNMPLQVALDLGLGGLVAYGAWLLAVTAVIGGWMWGRTASGWTVDDRQLLTGDSGQRPVWGIGILASLVAFHAYGLGDAVALGAKPGILLWWLLGLAAIGRSNSHAQAGQRGATDTGRDGQ
jgi:putative inorganic carbon (hco3(-)) transporter